tara:strand:+ start:73997 stop:74521 length:525 start_codon:yes stop_codon:yes gene_type:complete
VSLGEKVLFIGAPHILLRKRGAIIIGDNCKFISGETANPIGLNHKCIIRSLLPEAKILIGKNVGMSGSTILARQSIRIGDDVLIGANCLITDSDHHPIDPVSRLSNSGSDIKSHAIEIGSNVWLGGGVMVLKGVKIGDNTVVGAGSVVTSTLPANVIAAGNPAKVIRRIGEYDE